MFVIKFSSLRFKISSKVTSLIEILVTGVSSLITVISVSGFITSKVGI